jgi:hypothetical protein
VANLRWTRRTGWIALSITLLSGLIIAYLIFSNAAEKESGWLVVLLFGAIGGVALATNIIVSGDPTNGARHWSAWLQPKPIALIFASLVYGGSLLASMLPLLDPEPATKRDIDEAVGKILAPKNVAQPRIVKKLRGLWGEPGCKWTYWFTIKEEAVIVDRINPAGAPRMRSVGTIIKSEGDVMNMTTEVPESGTTVTFTYTTNGITERLIWDDNSKPVPLELVKCGEELSNDS